ncbi:MAG: response regulator [Nitrospira sp.]|jgi:DNA-binding response OmpR family regulator|uniref:response regulator n=1 Tax=Nitrospira sp. ND1 TaxID=1658518 RepID=UPI0009B9B4CB|nr:response regulator [Nitrospira sp. ND1]MBK7419849.1 response regulator [Nitrospira sp.]MBK7486550.1 response regulator [Nitrospira sp.]MBK8378372.1 response regulator [Nitrospira sp.]MBP6205092.1 response regulator [Nitrospira sp.]MBP8200227.1 response regulator [Nitrospira sp.]
MGSTIFVIDSSPAVHRMVEQISAPEGHKVMGFSDGPSALDAARKLSPALVIADYHLDKITFSGLCKEIGRQDSLAETLIVSMVDGSDRLDESKLRSLGVRAFLKKPLQREQLLDTIKGILNGAAGDPRGGKSAKTRTWPPVSTGTDDEDDESPNDASIDDAPHHEMEKEHSPMSPSLSPTAAPAASAPASNGPSGDALMKGLFDHLLHSVTVQADRKIGELLPPAMAKEVAGQVSLAVGKAVQTEVAKQLADALAPERLQPVMRELILEELKRQAQTQLAGVEATVRRTVTELAPTLVEQSTEKRLGDLTDTGVKKHLPEALKSHLETIDQLVKKEVEQVAANCARQAADEIVHEMAKDPIQQAVQRIVPDVAETQIRVEIKRLSSPD